MFGLGYQELLIILVIVLILFGANRLPELAKSLGSSVKEFKKGVTEAEKADTAAAAKKDDEKKACTLPPLNRAGRVDLACASALSLLTVLSRLPYRARIAYNWDAVQFAMALSEYDMEKHQPHPPGYILYVALGRLVNAWLADPAASYVALAVAFSGLTTFVVYYLAHAVYDRPTALAAAALLAVSPLSWFYGAVGLTYAGEALLASWWRTSPSARSGGATLTPGWPRLSRSGRGDTPVDPDPPVSPVAGLDRPRHAPRPDRPRRPGHPCRGGARVVRADDLAHGRSGSVPGGLVGAGRHGGEADVGGGRALRHDRQDVALPARVAARRSRVRLPSRRCSCPGTSGATAGGSASGSSSGGPCRPSSSIPWCISDRPATR